MAGITGDASILLNHARLEAQRYFYAYREPMPIEQLVQVRVRACVCDMHNTPLLPC